MLRIVHFKMIKIFMNILSIFKKAYAQSVQFLVKMTENYISRNKQY